MSLRLPKGFKFQEYVKWVIEPVQKIKLVQLMNEEGKEVGYVCIKFSTITKFCDIHTIWVNEGFDKKKNITLLLKKALRDYGKTHCVSVGLSDEDPAWISTFCQKQGFISQPKKTATQKNTIWERPLHQ